MPYLDVVGKKIFYNLSVSKCTSSERNTKFVGNLFFGMK